MTEEEKRELFLILDYYLIYSKKTDQLIVGGKYGELEAELQKFITRVKNGDTDHSDDNRIM